MLFLAGGGVLAFFLTREQPVYLKSVTLNQTERSYYLNEVFDYTGLYFIAEYSDGRKENIELTIGGDLLNQITASTYGTYSVGNAFVGIYGACSTSVLGMIIGSNFIDDGRCNNASVVVSSHNLSSEKQFRNPIEYGAPRPSSATFTATGSIS